jgi:hypothetical protein
VDEVRRSLDEASLERINAKLMHERQQTKTLKGDKEGEGEREEAEEGEQEEGGEEEDKEEREQKEKEKEKKRKEEEDMSPSPTELMELSNQYLGDIHEEIEKRKEALADLAAEEEERAAAAGGGCGTAGDEGDVAKRLAAERRQKREAKARFLDLLADICNLRVQLNAYRSVY